MNNKYYLVGEYKTVPVYYSKKQGFSLGSRMDKIVEPTELETKEIIAELGGMSKIERMVNNYERTKRLEEKKNGTRKITSRKI